MAQPKLDARARYRGALEALAQLDKSDLEATLRAMVSVASRSLEVSRVSYWELTPDRGALRCCVLFERSPADPAAQFTSGYELRADNFPAYFDALLTHGTIVADDAWTDPRTCEFTASYFVPHDIRAMLDVPVWRRGKLAGVLCHEHVGDVRAWSPAEQDFAGGVGNLIAIALEATDRRRAEERYDLVARTVHDVLWDWDVSKGMVSWSEALSLMFGYPLGTVSTPIEWWEAHIHPEDRETVGATLAAAFAGTDTTWTQQYRLMRGDGSGRYANVLDRGHIVRDEAGTAVRMVGTMIDLTERMALQARLALSERMASIGTLAAGVAHEINNPLTYLMANLESVIDELRAPHGDPAAAIALVREAQEGAERVRRIVRDLQVFSLPREDDVEDVEPHAVVTSTLTMAWNEIRHRARLVEQLAPIPRVRMNRARLGQVVLNLLVNAAQAIPEGRVDENVITVSTWTTAHGEALIEIRDTGPGIDPAIRTQVFEPFFTTKPVGVGTGLGLSICHSIVAAASGRIEVESPPSGGCIMRVVLPGVVTTQPVVTPTVVTTAPRRILVIDDEPHIRKAMRRLLEPRHDVTVAEDGMQALEAATSGDFDIVLCDLMMPRMTGMDFYNELVERKSPLASRVIFMTGGAFSHRSSEFLRECPRPYLEKPIARATLNDALAAVLD